MLNKSEVFACYETVFKFQSSQLKMEIVYYCVREYVLYFKLVYNFKYFTTKGEALRS